MICFSKAEIKPLYNASMISFASMKRHFDVTKIMIIGLAVLVLILTVADKLGDIQSDNHYDIKQTAR